MNNILIELCNQRPVLLMCNALEVDHSKALIHIKGHDKHIGPSSTITNCVDVEWVNERYYFNTRIAFFKDMHSRIFNAAWAVHSYDDFKARMGPELAIAYHDGDIYSSLVTADIGYQWEIEMRLFLLKHWMPTFSSSEMMQVLDYYYNRDAYEAARVDALILTQGYNFSTQLNIQRYASEMFSVMSIPGHLERMGMSWFKHTDLTETHISRVQFEAYAYDQIAQTYEDLGRTSRVSGFGDDVTIAWNRTASERLFWGA